MHLNIEQSLSHYNVHYSLEEADSSLYAQVTAKTCMVTMLLLEDSLGAVQILMPKHKILDLSSLCEHTGRNLQGMQPKKQQSLLEQFDAETIPALPTLTTYYTMVDSSLFDMETLWLDSGTNQQYIKLNQEDFQRTLGTSEKVNFSITPSYSSQGDTTAQISSAVQTFTPLRIKKRLDETLEIPPMPHSADQVIRLRSDPDAGISELVKVIEVDPTLAAQLISWASSPYYGAQGEITSVHDAIMRVLGFDLVINLALGITLGKTLSVPTDGPQSSYSIWEQSIYTANCMEAMARKAPPEHGLDKGTAYLIGLLSNLGSLLLGHIFPPYFSAISRSIEANTHINPHVIEYQIIGLCSHQINAWLLNNWNLSSNIVDAIQCQHDDPLDVTPTGPQSNNYAKLLYLSTHLLRQLNIVDGPAATLSKTHYEQLGLDSHEVESILEEIVSKQADIKAMAEQFNQ